MILKKPYAFLIKYYRLIHFVILCLTGILAYKYLSIVNFFNTYIKNGYTLLSSYNLHNIYVPAWLYILCIFIPILSIIILVLLKYKNKPFTSYIFLIIYYFALFIGLFYISSMLTNLESSLLDSQIARAIRDILLLSFVPQLGCIALVLVKTLGFNIKKFDFESQFSGSGLDLSDSEEVEVNINLDFSSYVRKFWRFIREVGYYFQENKIILYLIIGIIVIVVGIFSFKTFFVTGDVTYSMNKSFTYKNIQIEVKDAIVSNVNYNGTEIDSNKCYAIVKFNVKNLSNKIINLDSNTFYLKVHGTKISPNKQVISYFIDYDFYNFKSLLDAQEESTFILGYEFDKKYMDNKLSVIIQNGFYEKNGKDYSKSIIVNLNKKININEKNTNTFHVNDNIVFDKSFLKNTSIKISDYSIVDSYIYDYDICYKEDCKKYKDIISLNNKYPSSLMLISNVDFKLDESTHYTQKYVNLASFANNFINVEYIVNDVKYNSLYNLTPDKVDNIIALQVNSNIKNASEISLIITIRNNEYVVKLK